MYIKNVLLFSGMVMPILYSLDIQIDLKILMEN